MTDAVPAPAADPLVTADVDAVGCWTWDQLVRKLMEARDCSWPAAEEYIAEHGEDQAERVVRARWRDVRGNTA